jgi:hypothetical protein
MLGCHICPTIKMSEALFVRNVRPHTSISTTEAVTNSGWGMLPHPFYGPDIAPSDYQPYGPWGKNACKNITYATDKVLYNTMHQWLQRRNSNFYHVGIHALVQRWKKTVNKEAAYVQKKKNLQQCCRKVLQNSQMPNLQAAMT